MTLCPIAIVAGCKKCPAFSICPLKTVIGDAPKQDEGQTTQETQQKPRRPTSQLFTRPLAKPCILFA
jgi:hypothetical protein